MSTDATVGDLQTPCVLIDRSIFKQNCIDMQDAARRNGMLFRAHVKSHKTAQGTILMLQPKGTAAEPDLAGKTIVSTVEEGWGLVQDGLVADGTVTDILFSLPPSANQLARLRKLRDALPSTCILRLMVDDPEQIGMLDEDAASRADDFTWSLFVKVDCGGHRAGLIPGSSQFEALVQTIFRSSRVRIHGFYSHAGQSYASRNANQASAYLRTEIDGVTEASLIARKILDRPNDVVVRARARQAYQGVEWVLSIGATPTAHAAVAKQASETEPRGRTAGGRLELHAGVYPLNDLQQLATSMIDLSQVSLSILTTVNSTYPGRGAGFEACCDAGGLAMSKDTGPEEGYGRVIGCGELDGWRLGRVSQEHGILTHPHAETAPPTRAPAFGELLRLVPPHACFTLANHAVYHIVDSSLEESENWKSWRIREEWKPWKFW